MTDDGLAQVEMEPTVRAAAEAARGFMPPDEGLALFRAGVARSEDGTLVVT